MHVQVAIVLGVVKDDVIIEDDGLAILSIVVSLLDVERYALC